GHTAAAAAEIVGVRIEDRGGDAAGTLRADEIGTPSEIAKMISLKIVLAAARPLLLNHNPSERRAVAKNIVDDAHVCSVGGAAEDYRINHALRILHDAGERVVVDTRTGNVAVAGQQ